MCCGREGYVGLVRREDGAIDAAMAVRPKAMRELGGPAGAARVLIARCGGDTSGVGDSRWRGTPMLTRRRRAANGSVFAAGDAAGYLEPFTGEGMSWAIESGFELAELLRSRPAGAEGLDRAWRARMARARRRRWTCGVVAAALRSPTVVRAVIAGAARWPGIASAGAERVGAARAEPAP
jgi:2-polyprenyl-6-methoxyphenol hydroxylase-like FAD-dependent oxidoreductase